MKASLLGAAVAAVAPLDLLGGTKGRPKKGGAELKISLQEGVTPGETLKEKLDFMENHGVVGLEPNGAGLAGRVGGRRQGQAAQQQDRTPQQRSHASNGLHIPSLPSPSVTVIISDFPRR